MPHGPIMQSSSKIITGCVIVINICIAFANLLTPHWSVCCSLALANGEPPPHNAIGCIEELQLCREVIRLDIRWVRGDKRCGDCDGLADSELELLL